MEWSVSSATNAYLDTLKLVCFNFFHNFLFFFSLISFKLTFYDQGRSYFFFFKHFLGNHNFNVNLSVFIKYMHHFRIIKFVHFLRLYLVLKKYQEK